MALRIIKSSDLKTTKENLIIFIHGFIGGVETWIRNDNQKSILDHLKEENSIVSEFDFAVFDYYTELVDKIDRIKGIVKSIFGKNTSPSKNIEITNIAQILISEIRYLETRYKNIVIISHSLGGLVAKSLIIEDIKKKSESSIALYISLAVPHKGSNLAVLGKAILGNPQVENLQPLSEKINQLTDDWLTFSEKLPPTVYFQGKYDQIVPNTSSRGLDIRDIEIVYTDDDHFSIVKPIVNNDIVIRAIKYHLSQLFNIPKNKTGLTIENNTEFKNLHYEKVWDSLDGLRVYFDTGMRNDIERFGKVNPEPVFKYINSVSESKLYIESNLFEHLCLFYEQISSEANANIAQSIIYYFENKERLTQKEVVELETKANTARASISNKIENFMITHSNKFRKV